MARPSTMPPGTEQKLIAFVEMGLTDDEIGRRFGRKQSTITAWRRKLFIGKGSRQEWAAKRRTILSLTNY